MANELASLADMSVGGGLASMAKSTVSLRKAYNQYASEVMESGQDPMPFEEWAKTQSNG